ncbi:MAG: IS66 family transposase [Verrucomicrobiaceae bacterium]|nr:IS66 family transposase [Verrucomicrobiaceae bacterium]
MQGSISPGNGETKQGYFWACKRPGADVSFHWQISRSARCLDHIIPADFTGTVQCDGYNAYPSFANRSDGRITLAACWAHARRKFHEAKESAPQHAGWLLLQIQHLYRIEAHLREKRAGPRQRQAVRSSQSRMIVSRIHKALTRFKLSGQHLPQSAMGKAIDYTLTLWPLLLIYLDDGRLEIDNNEVENAIRPTAVGKKNCLRLRRLASLEDAAIAAGRWLFIGEAQAGERSAIFFTVIEACRRRGIDPQSYLREVLTRLPTMTNRQIKEVTPEAWAKAQPASAQRKAA